MLLTATQMIEHMLNLQEEMNCKVHPKWREQNYRWHLAITNEAAEFYQHLGYEWWKKAQEPDVPQACLELVDVGCFLFSAMLEVHYPRYVMQSILGSLDTGSSVEEDHRMAIHFLSTLVGGCTSATTCYPHYLFTAASYLGLTFEEFYKLYIGKNTLNIFRQNHGYKEGAYRKIWDGEEDNVHLYHLCKSITAADENLQETIYNQLEIAYGSSV